MEKAFDSAQEKIDLAGQKKTADEVKKVGETLEKEEQAAKNEQSVTDKAEAESKQREQKLEKKLKKVNEKANKMVKDSQDPKKAEAATTVLKKEYEKEAEKKTSLFQYESPLGVKYMDYEGLKITI